jgi:hypothetical protein
METKDISDRKNFNVETYVVLIICVILLTRVEVVTRVAIVTCVADVTQLNIGTTRCLKINIRTKEHIFTQTHR